MEKIKLSAVSYLNTKPFLYGLFKSPLANRLQLSLDIPSICAEKLSSGEVDLALVPVAVMAQLPQAQIVSDYCIGTLGAVKTVCIYSERPLDQMTSLYLDHHSRTSVALSKILLREYWQVKVNYLQAEEGYIQKIGGTTAGLVIGDRTIGLQDRFEYVYDLGEAWLAHTGLPFVFAAWLSLHPLDPVFLAAFNQALAKGVEEIPQLIYLLPNPHPDFDLQDYFTHNISYELDEAKKEALALFLQKMKDTEAIGKAKDRMLNSPIV
ncbi:MAG TPA: menaquinone biosynthesis protein [Saprospiraceae bacterium]|nr:menaquinone biosynthesis protein [Saprospiraceae bacterium]HMQ85861.1 menaquinone biosynthesis protein [Saprospiraceae bacterium]